MRFSLEYVLLIAVLGIAGVHWWRSLAVRELAVTKARAHCEALGLQFLDGGAALRGIWLKRDRRGRPCIWRSYEFEFSATGGERYRGRITTLADRVEAIHLPPHRLGEAGDR